MNKRFKKKLFRILDKYGIFNERLFIKKKYKEDLYKDLLNLYEKYEEMKKRNDEMWQRRWDEYELEQAEHDVDE